MSIFSIHFEQTFYKYAGDQAYFCDASLQCCFPCSQVDSSLKGVVAGPGVLGFTMFESAVKDNVMQGERFIFEKRQLLDAAGAGSSEDALRASGSVSLKVWERAVRCSPKSAEKLKAKAMSLQPPKELVAAPVQIGSKVSLYIHLVDRRLLF